MMRILLGLLVVVLLVADTFSLNMSLGPGMSIKNAMLYVLALGLMLQAVVGEQYRLQLPGIHAAFGVLIVAAILSWLVAGVVVDYPGYRMLRAAIPLKNNLVDHLIFLLVFFYGARTRKQALDVVKVMLAAFFVANAITILDVSGILRLGIIEVKSGEQEGRVSGALGEANQYAAVLALLLPAYLAASVAARGARRFAWGLAALTALTALIMTVSRGAFVGVAIALVVGALLFRRYLSLGRIFGWGAGLLVVVALVLVPLSGEYGQLLKERVFEQTLNLDAGVASSGRTAIWGQALEVMARAPWTFITGYGWYVYEWMPFRYLPHNHYLGLWFELGLVGLGCFLAIVVQTLGTVRRAVPVAGPQTRPFLIAFVFGFIALAVAIFFVDLTQPWAYVWSFTGLMLRVAVSELEREPALARATVAAPARGLGHAREATSSAHARTAR